MSRVGLGISLIFKLHLSSATLIILIPGEEIEHNSGMDKYGVG